MFQNDELKKHLEESFTIESQTAAIAEWNMNIPGNIFKLGNYRYRKTDTRYGALPNIFDKSDVGNFYTGATNSDVVIKSGLEEDEINPILFSYPKIKEKLYFSLEDCVKPFRPRSGINKAVFGNNKYLANPNKNMFQRPRYYMPHKEDEFKYWRSYRTESFSGGGNGDGGGTTPPPPPPVPNPKPVVVSIKGYVKNIHASGGLWTGTIDDLTSTSPLVVGALISSTNGLTEFVSATGTISNIITGSGTFTATLSNLASTSRISVGDKITAINGTGSLASIKPYAGTVTEIINSTSLKYSVTISGTPHTGTVTDVYVTHTVAGSLGSGKVKITSIDKDADTITFITTGGTQPIAGHISAVSTITYPSITLANKEYGISKNNTETITTYGISGSSNYIDDANPFVVYKESVPANRLIVKVQTHVGDINLGPFKNSSGTSFKDPFYGDANKVVPKKFKVEYLDANDNWTIAYTFNENSLRDDGVSPIFNSDGYLSLQYGIEIPIKYKNNFILVGNISSESVLPEQNILGYAYLLTTEANTKGTMYVCNGGTNENKLDNYDIFTPKYNWQVGTDGVYENTQFVTDFVNPSFFYEQNDRKKIFREFVFVKGIRIAVETMSIPNVSFDLIEFSPRLVANITDMLVDFQITKVLSDMSASSLPVGQLLASTGKLTIFDGPEAFNLNNIWNGESGSIIAKYVQKNIKMTFYEVINNVNNNNYYIPLKTLYSDGIPQVDQNSSSISMNLRDFYFYFESVLAPEILLTEVSLSQAVGILLDHIGFSNYVFKRLPSENDPIIPYFFIAPQQNVAQVLSQIAMATQSGMFFDEYNNFVVMTKEYLLDDTNTRALDFTFYGNETSSSDKAIENKISGKLSNIISISSQDKKVFNAGTINYTTRYIQRSYGTIKQSMMTDQEKTWIYKPVLLWEISGTEMTKTQNAEKQSTYTLAAMPLNSDVTNLVPTVVNNQVINNIIDFGENIYYITRYQGYFYSNGEIIKYDAVQFNITGIGNVWIKSNAEYQNYFSQLPFNGKIYPTGLVKVYSEPFYETISGITKLKNGPVSMHGRGQFGTTITSHASGIDQYWSNNNYVQGCKMDSKYIFNTDPQFVDSINGTLQLANSTTGTVGTITALLGGFSAQVTGMVDTGGFEVGMIISATPGTGTLYTGTPVSHVISKIINATSIEYVVAYETPAQIATNAALVPPPTPVDYSGNATPGSITNLTEVSTSLKLPSTVTGTAGIGLEMAKSSQRNGVIKNFLSSFFSSDSAVKYLKTTSAGTIQSSALVFNGPEFSTSDNPRDFISYVWKDLSESYKHFGTRLRIIGKVETASSNSQSLVGGSTYYNIPGIDPTQTVSIGGGSAGICIANPKTNNGYYFELTALTTSDVTSYQNTNTTTGEISVALDNVNFYKIKRNKSAGSDTDLAIPVKLWGGVANIIVDDGNFTGQYRVAGEQNPTVYDLSIEYVDVNATTRAFYLYINNKLVQVITDYEPLPLVGNTMGIFVRGSAKAMFENIYAINRNYSDNSTFALNTPIASVFGEDKAQVNANDAMSKYAMSGVVQKTYLTGISPSGSSQYKLYYDEFGSIMRECEYFNIKYDKAYPALYAKISNTFNRLKGYVVSGFMASSYGAEFLIFNATDSVLSLDETSGNYLRIQGIAFTQDTTHSLTVDDYYKKKGSLSNPELKGDSTIQSPFTYIEDYDKITTSRLLYGKNEFSLDSPYIQDQSTAEELIGWIAKKNLKPRKLVGLNIFSIPTLQLGDVVTIHYKNEDGLDILTPESTRYTVYNIDYSKSVDGTSMNVFLSEV